jgi:capsid portal protein
MQNLKSHEQIVLDILVSGIIPNDTLKEIKNDPMISEYNVTGNGYFLTMKHQNMPVERKVCDKPMLIGESGGIETGFIVFIENGELTIECHGWGDREIPQDYREFDIQIKKA